VRALLDGTAPDPRAPAFRKRRGTAERVTTRLLDEINKHHREKRRMAPGRRGSHGASTRVEGAQGAFGRGTLKKVPPKRHWFHLFANIDREDVLRDVRRAEAAHAAKTAGSLPEQPRNLAARAFGPRRPMNEQAQRSMRRQSRAIQAQAMEHVMRKSAELRSQQATLSERGTFESQKSAMTPRSLPSGTANGSV